MTERQDSTATTHYLNADFDLTLRPRPRQLERPVLQRQVRELSVQALLGADNDDCALLRAHVPDEFLDYLAASGLPVPRILTHPRIDPVTNFRPFGWNAEALELNRGHLRPTRHPTPACIRRVNSRSFARSLEAELAGREPDSAVVESRAALESFLVRDRTTDQWVVKSEFGHAGLANRRLRSAALTAADRRFVDERLAEDDRLVVEPWRNRDRDWSIVFGVPLRADCLRVYDTVSTRDGGWIGAWLTPEGADLGAWREELDRAIERIGHILEVAGYFGPVCVDAFRWLDGGQPRLRPLVDLNARRPMSDPAYRLWRRTVPDRHLYYRFFARRRLRLPDELSELVVELGERGYDNRTRRGILVASPLLLYLDHEPRRPTKLALMLVGCDRAEVLRLEDWFRRRFEV